MDVTRYPRPHVILHCDPPWRGASCSCLPLSALCNSLGMCCAAYVAVASPACPSNTAARETAWCGATARSPAATPCSGCRAASTCLSSMRALRPGVCRAAGPNTVPMTASQCMGDNMHKLWTRVIARLKPYALASGQLGMQRYTRWPCCWVPQCGCVLTADEAMKTRVNADPLLLLLLLLLLPLRGLLELATAAAECGTQSCFSGSHTCACGMLPSCWCRLCCCCCWCCSCDVTKGAVRVPAAADAWGAVVDDTLEPF
jgi:hypothetical protein